jgi:hypothetical protein
MPRSLSWKYINYICEIETNHKVCHATHCPLLGCTFSHIWMESISQRQTWSGNRDLKVSQNLEAVRFIVRDFGSFWYFGRRLRGLAAETPAQFQNDPNPLTMNLAASRLSESSRKNAFCDIVTGPSCLILISSFAICIRSRRAHIFDKLTQVSFITLLMSENLF